MGPKRLPLGRLPLLLFAGVSLLLAIWAGLARLGWRLPGIPPGQHGPLMIAGFLGTLISLERAVALAHNSPRRRWLYLAPLLSGLGALGLLAGLPLVAGQWLILLASLGMVWAFGLIFRLQPSTAHATMGAGALFWTVGNSLWLGGLPLAQVVGWWAGFLVLTVAGERLELARMMRLRPESRAAFIGAALLLFAGLTLALVQLEAGIRLAGAGLLALGGWLLAFDIARRTVRQAGLTRFIALCLLLGYFWLLVGGALWLIYGGGYSAGPIYDAMLHTIFLGFIFSMIFGHAPIILPAVLGLPLGFLPLFYLHLGLLHLSLALRVAGDLLPSQPLRLWGGVLNAVALVLFLLASMMAARRGRGRA
jgi:hypothetical protein